MVLLLSQSGKQLRLVGVLNNKCRDFNFTGVHVASYVAILEEFEILFYLGFENGCVEKQR